MKKELESLKESPTGVEVPGVGKTSGMSDAGCFPVCLSHYKQDTQYSNARLVASFNNPTHDHLIYDLVEIACLKNTQRQIVPDKG